MSDDNVPPEGGNAQAAVIAFVERLERIHEEIGGLQEDFKEVLGEAKGQGFDVSVIRKVLSIRRQGVGKWREGQDLLETYLMATGDLG